MPRPSALLRGSNGSFTTPISRIRRAFALPGGTSTTAKRSAKQVALAEDLGLRFPDGTTREGAHDALEAAMTQARLKDPAAPWRPDPTTPTQIAWLTAHRIRMRDHQGGGGV